MDSRRSKRIRFTDENAENESENDRQAREAAAAEEDTVAPGEETGPQVGRHEVL